MVYDNLWLAIDPFQKSALVLFGFLWGSNPMVFDFEYWEGRFADHEYTRSFQLRVKPVTIRIAVNEQLSKDRNSNVRAVGIYGDIADAKLAIKSLTAAFNRKGPRGLCQRIDGTGMRFIPLPSKGLPSLSAKRQRQLPYIRASQARWLRNHTTVSVSGIDEIDRLVSFERGGKTIRYTLRQILCTMKQPLDLKRPLISQIHFDRSTECREYLAIVHKELEAEAKNILGHLPPLLEVLFGHNSNKWFTPEHLADMRNFVYDPDSGEICRQSDECSSNRDIEHIDDNLDPDDVDNLEEKHQDALDASVSVRFEGLEALDSVHIPDDSIDAGGSIGSCATGTSNHTQKMNDANLQSDAGDYPMRDDEEHQSAITVNDTNGTEGSPTAKTSVYENHE